MSTECKKNDLSHSAIRVQKFLASKGLTLQVKEFPKSTRTAQEAADSIGCSLSQIAKSLVFIDEKHDRPLLIIASGSNRVNVKKVENTLDLKLRQADGKFVKERVGFAIGGVPPAGHPESLLTILDSDLKQHQTIWAAAGTPHAVFRLTPAELEHLTAGRWLNLAE
jgi:prolyl-tRNA editing enzyme YbaK/EbsC (Cys-tRNA(Pro) deacylase)